MQCKCTAGAVILPLPTLDFAVPPLTDNTTSQSSDQQSAPFTTLPSSTDSCLPSCPTAPSTEGCLCQNIPMPPHDVKKKKFQRMLGLSRSLSSQPLPSSSGRISRQRTSSRYPRSAFRLVPQANGSIQQASRHLTVPCEAHRNHTQSSAGSSGRFDRRPENSFINLSTQSSQRNDADRTERSKGMLHRLSSAMWTPVRS
jgi:hypothetical protein